jgi:2-dehydro-3-deoxygalactonokinase
MRGEETQILGELARRSMRTGRFVLPGTHSKWATVEDGCITAFATYMTGEVFAVLRQHSILGRLMRDAGHDAAAFRQGVAQGTATGAKGLLLHDLFGARTLGLMGDLPGTALASYLSGLLIGAELNATAGDVPAIVLGAGPLTALYIEAAAHLGLAAEPGGADCIVSGLLALAHAAGLLESRHG